MAYSSLTRLLLCKYRDWIYHLYEEYIKRPLLWLRQTSSVMFYMDCKLKTFYHKSKLLCYTTTAIMNFVLINKYKRFAIISLYKLWTLDPQQSISWPEWAAECVCEVCKRGGSRDDIPVEKVVCSQRPGSTQHSSQPKPHLQGVFSIIATQQHFTETHLKYMSPFHSRLEILDCHGIW